MEIFPAIDLRSGKCVRLVQGDYDRQIDYDPDPCDPALRFEKAGSKYLHIIDLDGAKEGTDVNYDTIKRIVEKVNMKVEVGGGIRDEKTIAKMLDMGVWRVIVGTSAIKNFEWFEKMADKFAGKLALSLDAKGAMAAVSGWTQESSFSVIDLAKRADQLDINGIIYTDITRDGMMTGPNLERTKELTDAVDSPVTAAGGVTSLPDIENLSQIGVHSAIIGRALYEGSISLDSALELADKL